MTSSRRSKSNLILFLSLLALGAGFLLVNLYDSSATVLAAGPTQSPGTGSGALATDASGNLGIGSVPSSSVKLLIQAPNALSTNYALSVIKQNGTPILQAGNDGTVTIPGLVGGAGVNANNVSAGQFGANTGNGNYSFPAGLGIGTTAPTSLLDIRSQNSTPPTATIGSVTASFAANQVDGILGFGTFYSPNSVYYQAGTISGLSEATGDSNFGALTFSTRSAGTVAEKMRITSAGNVGIGTATPLNALHVQGNGLRIGSGVFGSSGFLFSQNGTGDLVVNYMTGATTYSTPMTIGYAGNIGIGTVSTTSTLTVAGEIKTTSGGVRFPDGTVQVTAAGAATPHIQTFTTSGTWTWPAGVSEVWVTTCGGGGGGGGGVSSGGNGGAGGGGAQCFYHRPVAVSGNVSVTVGGGGSGGGVNANGTNGGNSLFGGAITVFGGGYGESGAGSGAGAGAGGASGGGFLGAVGGGGSGQSSTGDGLSNGGGGGGAAGNYGTNQGGSSGAFPPGKGYIAGLTSGCGSGGASGLGKGGDCGGGVGGGNGAGGGGGNGIGLTPNAGGGGSPGIVIVEWMQ